MSYFFARFIRLATIPSPFHRTTVIIRIVPSGLTVPPRGYSCTGPHVRISYKPLPPLDTSVIEGCAVTVEVDGSELRLVSAYLRSAVWTAPPQRSRRLSSTNLPTIVTGDLNAKHPSWNSRIANAYGKSLYRFVSDNPALQVIGPDDPTHFPFTGQQPGISKNVIHHIQVSRPITIPSL